MAVGESAVCYPYLIVIGICKSIEVLAAIVLNAGTVDEQAGKKLTIKLLMF